MGMLTEPAALDGDGAAAGARLAVIGAGVSGVLTAIHLLWRCRPEDKIYLVEKSARLGPGVAYGTRHPRHLVNIRAENMSAFADQPDHFAKWLARLPEEERLAAGRKTLAGLFVRRDVYGRYVQELLGDTIIRQGGFQNLYIVTDHATALRPAAGGAAGTLVMETEGGRAYELDAVVLAVGNLPPADPELPGYIADPWAGGTLDGIVPGHPVLLLGTGLTAVDVLLMLQDRGFEGPVLALSRRGLLPRAHAPASPWADLRLETSDRRSLPALTRAVRREVRRAASVGVDWRCVMDALRPQLRAVWRDLPQAERARFVRHLRPYWDVHRHRMAPPVAEAVAAALASGAFEVAAGRVEAVESSGPPGKGLRVRWRPRGGGAAREIVAQRVVDCRGPGADYARLADPLVRQLLADGLVRPDPYRLGLETTAWGHLVGRDGGSSPAILAVGPVTRGTFWETTSVPDIRGQAEQVAVSALAAARKAVLAQAG